MLFRSVVTDQLTGLTVTTNGLEAMIFDTANPTGGDTDLASDALGNVLILSEDGNSTNPDDNAVGGTFIFTFDEAMNIASLDVLDSEEGGSIEAMDLNGVPLGSTAIVKTADGELGTTDINVDGVSQLVVTLNGSGAIAELTFA